MAKAKEGKNRVEKSRSHNSGKKPSKKKIRKEKSEVANTSEPLPVRIYLGPSHPATALQGVPDDGSQEKIYVYEDFGEVGEAGRSEMEGRIKKHFRKQLPTKSAKKARHEVLRSYGIKGSEDKNGNEDSTPKYSKLMEILGQIESMHGLKDSQDAERKERGAEIAAKAEDETKKAEDAEDENGGEAYNQEFPSIKQGLSLKLISKARKQEKQDAERKERGVEIAAKTEEKLKKKAAKKTVRFVAEPEPSPQPSPHGLTPPKAIQSLTVAANSLFDDDDDKEVPAVRDDQALVKPNKKEEKRLRRLEKTEKNNAVAVSRPKSIDKLAGLLNKRSKKYSGPKFADLLDLAEKLLVVDALPGATIEQKSNKIYKDIRDMRQETKEIEHMPAESGTDVALVLREETPEAAPEVEERPKSRSETRKAKKAKVSGMALALDEETLEAAPAMEEPPKSKSEARKAKKAKVAAPKVASDELKSKKRKREEEPNINLEANLDHRPIKKMKKSRTH